MDTSIVSAPPSTSPRDLLLASTSRYRRALLERLGVPFRVTAPLFDETSLKGQGIPPRELAETLAYRKAWSLVDVEPRATILGSDQLVAYQGEVLGKPGSEDAAIAQLRRLAGQTHELVTSLVVVHGGQVWRHTDVARLHMRPLSDAELARYVRADMPVDCAGSYKLEQRGVTLFDSIECADHSAITGLPLIGLTTILRDIGYSIP